MEGWKKYKLGEITKWNSGGTPPKMKPEYWNGNIPWISAKSLKGRYVCDSDLKITEAGLKKGSRLATKGSVLLLVRGSGLYNDIPVAMTTKDVAYNQDVKCVVPMLDDLSNNFLLYWFKGNKTKLSNILEATSIGAGKFDMDRLFNLEVNLPPLHEQKAIASILSVLDDKIELNLQMNKTLKEMAMTLYKHWFVDFGPFQDGEFVDSELGMIPEGWEVERINSFGKVVCGKTPSKKDENNFCSDGGYQFIKIPDMHGRVFVFETFDKISDQGNKMQLNKLLPAGSINVSCIATVGLVTINSLPAHTNQQINSIILDKPTHRYYLYISMLNLKDRFMNEASGGSATLNMNTSTFSSIELLKPLNTELEKFDLLVSNLFEQINQNAIEAQTLTTLRDTLLPKLISGEVRLKDIEHLVAASL